MTKLDECIRGSSGDGRVERRKNDEMIEKVREIGKEGSRGRGRLKKKRVDEGMRS